MRRTPFRVESEVRRWISGRVDGLWRIEPRSGSTFGLPDLLVAIDSEAVLIELKLAKRRRDGRWAIGVNRNQLTVSRQLKSAGLRFLCVAGVFGTRDVGILSTFDGLEIASRNKNKLTMVVSAWDMKFHAETPPIAAEWLKITK